MAERGLEGKGRDSPDDRTTGAFGASCRRSSNTSLSIRTSPTLPVGPAGERVQSSALSAGRCPFHVVPLLEGRQDGRRAAALEVGCRRLSCPACLARRRGLWLAHLTDVIATAAKC